MMELCVALQEDVEELGDTISAYRCHPALKQGADTSLLTEPLAAQVYPRQWELMMLRLQATSAGHTWDSAAQSLVLLIQPGVSSVQSNSGVFTGSARQVFPNVSPSVGLS